MTLSSLFRGRGVTYLEAASSLRGLVRGYRLIQHGSYIGYKRTLRTTQENSIVLEANTKRRILFHAQVNELSCGKLSYLYTIDYR